MSMQEDMTHEQWTKQQEKGSGGQDIEDDEEIDIQVASNSLEGV